LQAQINPHFIYNTINLFSAKTELAGLYDVSEAFADFGQILRYNMNNQSAYATIDQEIHHVLRYIRLQKMRFGERLTINWTCEEQILQTPIIRFILQPVVENSIAHGMRNRSRLLITLDVKQNSRREIIIIISDNGAGISDTKLATLNRFFEQGTNDAPPVFAQGTGSGIGLGNINERLRLFYGDVYTIKMESAEGHFTRTLITVPIREEMGGERHA
jgi:two-component system sensor histidine kinase YesM